MRVVHLHAGEELPPADAFDRIVVMGGPMGVHDDADHPWLKREKRYLREGIEAGKCILGVCLGAQLLADVLGAEVRRGANKEIGWFPVDFTGSALASGLFRGAARRLMVFHWHGDSFEIPRGALHLASSAGCANQGFLYDGRVLGLQFHMESTAESVSDILKHCGHEIIPAPYVQTAERMRSEDPEVYSQIHSALFRILDRLPG